MFGGRFKIVYPIKKKKKTPGHLKGFSKWVQTIHLLV